MTHAQPAQRAHGAMSWAVGLPMHSARTVCALCAHAATSCVSDCVWPSCVSDCVWSPTRALAMYCPVHVGACVRACARRGVGWEGLWTNRYLDTDAVMVQGLEDYLLSGLTLVGLSRPPCPTPALCACVLADT